MTLKQDLIDLNIEVSEKKFYFQLGAVPPIDAKDGSFLVGEAWGLGSKGELVYDCYIEQENQYYYGGRMSIKDFKKNF